MSPVVLLVVVFGYFGVLLAIAWYTSRGAGEHAFYSGERKSLWWVVAFGMVGTSLSGVTFVSVPGNVRLDHWQYLQMIFGFVVGYWLIAGVLLPLYYRLELTSIYGYLRQRLGSVAYRTGSAIFIISRLLGATVRIYVVLYVIHMFVLKDLGVPFIVSSGCVMLMIFLYTLQGGVKTIVWTDTLQTLFMLAALVGTIFYIVWHFKFLDLQTQLSDSGMMQIFNWDIKDKSFFFKQFISGVFITIVMTGMDQEMMQKNLSVRTLPDAQKNMIVFSVVMMLTNILFLFLGALLYVQAAQSGIGLPAKSDDLFPTMALQHFPPWLGLLFIVGLISALFPSADGALTALTASTCIDLIGIRDRGWSEETQRRVRQRVHALMAVVFLILILFFYARNDDSIITLLYGLAVITYGPLLGLFAFGIFTRMQARPALVPVVCILAAVGSYLLRAYSKELFSGYAIGFETLPINGLLTFLGLAAASIGYRPSQPDGTERSIQ